MSAMDTTFLARLLQTVPTYTEAEFELARGDVVKGMARDLPTTDGSARRWTVNGWEWFIDTGALDNLNLFHVRITSVPDITVW